MLYLLYGAEDFLGDQLEPSAIHFPRRSVKRGLLSEPNFRRNVECKTGRRRQYPTGQPDFVGASRSATVAICDRALRSLAGKVDESA